MVFITYILENQNLQSEYSIDGINFQASNVFQNVAGGIVTDMFGYTATWKPVDNSMPIQVAKVLYKDATESQKLSDADFTIERYIMEYKAGQFKGLKTSLDSGANEKIKIETMPGEFFEFYIRRMETKFDGKTIVAYLNPPEIEIV